MTQNTFDHKTTFSLDNGLVPSDNEASPGANVDSDLYHHMASLNSPR